MEQDVDNTMNEYRMVCSGCLSTDRKIVSINDSGSVAQIFRLLMFEFAGDRYVDPLVDISLLLCWECLALMKRFARFQRQVQSAQEHLRVLAISQTSESIDHTYMSQSLSSLEVSTKANYDSIFMDIQGVSTEKDHGWHQFITVSAPSVKSEEVRLANGQHTLQEIILDDVTALMPQIVVGPDMVSTEMNLSYAEPVKGEVSELIIDPITSETTVVLKPAPPVNVQPRIEKTSAKLGYTIEYMTEEEMLAAREEAKKKIHYASSVYKCELCIIGYYTEQQVQDHFLTVHKGGPGYSACKVCYVYVEYSKLRAHVEAHYTRYVCKLCAHASSSEQLASQHASEHRARAPSAALLHVADAHTAGKGRKKKEKESDQKPPTDMPKANLRKLLSKTTIVCYKCLECDMFFKTSRARKNHVARCHREGLQCDHCKKRFVNKTTLATHLRLHEGPLPREECPICHKMVRSIQLKYHIQRHENKSRYECKDCNKVFSHLTTYHAHLKYSRAHADEAVFKYPCPMCNKGYPTKESMQDHFNYQHLGKTTHKCPICNKPIASRANVDKHMMRVHGKQKEKPRNHICPECNKAFTDKKALKQHCVIHSSERPLACDVCQQTFKQKASLYTHRKRVHKLAPAKRTLTFMDS